MRLPLGRPAATATLEPDAQEAVRHPIHDVLAWQIKLERGELANRAALAKKLGVGRAVVTQTLRMLKLVPEIRKFLLSLKIPAEVRYFSVRRMGMVAELPAAKQLAVFEKARAAVRPWLG